jgi:hypothetical protein
VVSQQQVNNNGVQPKKSKRQKTDVRLAQAVTLQQQVLLPNQPQPQTFELKQVQEKTFQLVKTVQQQQQPQQQVKQQQQPPKQSTYQPRVVQVVQSPATKPPQLVTSVQTSTAVTSVQESYPVSML